MDPKSDARRPQDAPRAPPKNDQKNDKKLTPKGSQKGPKSKPLFHTFCVQRALWNAICHSAVLGDPKNMIFDYFWASFKSIFNRFPLRLRLHCSCLKKPKNMVRLRLSSKTKSGTTTATHTETVLPSKTASDNTPTMRD